MPDHRTHDAIGLVTAPIVAVSVEAWAGGGMGLVAATAHVFGSSMLSPDLDLDSAIDDRWGVFGFMWGPYTWAVKHRSVLSHSGISVFLRVAYLILIFEVGLFLAGLAGALDPATVHGALLSVAQAHPHQLMAIAIGLFTSDAMHSLADGV